MAYVKTNWVDNSTPINASNLNKIEDQLEENTNNIEENTDEITSINSAITPTYCKATTTTASTASSRFIVDLDDISFQTGEFTLQSSGIKIPSGINHIRVSGSIFLDNFPATSYIWALIRQNNAQVSGSINMGTGGFLSASVPPTIIEVQEGDIINLMADSPDGGTIRVGVGNTWLLVEKVD